MGEGFSVAVSCGVGHRRGWDPLLLWLWCRLAATAPIGPLTWEPPHAVKKKKKNLRIKNKLKKIHFDLVVPLWCNMLRIPGGLDPWPRNLDMPWVWPKKKIHFIF